MCTLKFLGVKMKACFTPDFGPADFAFGGLAKQCTVEH